MTTIENARTVLGQLTPGDRLKLLESLAHETVEVTPGIFRTPGVCGGDACVRGMRLPVWLLEEGRRRGATEEQLRQSHPDLTRDDLVHVWDYVSTHREEIDRSIQENFEV
ncbi:MAG: DUF433 domain-containing protein [Verrucomicrobiota bacterium]